MNELRRWSEEGGAPEELLALEAAREKRPSARSRARILSAVGVSATIAATSATSAAAGGTSFLAKIFLATVVVTAAGGAIWKLGRPAAREIAPSVEATVSTRGEPATAPHAEESASPERISAPTPAPGPDSADSPEATPTATPKAESPSRPRPLRATAPPGKLSAEVASLERARHALDSSSPDAALRELGEYDKKFPHGALGAEQVVLRVQALMASGDQARAVAVADQFAATHPESPYARRVQQMVRPARQK